MYLYRLTYIQIKNRKHNKEFFLTGRQTEGDVERQPRQSRLQSHHPSSSANIGHGSCDKPGAGDRIDAVDPTVGQTSPQPVPLELARPSRCSEGLLHRKTGPTQNSEAGRVRPSRVREKRHRKEVCPSGGSIGALGVSLLKGWSA